MKKLLYLFVASVVLTSCGGDDDAPVVNPTTYKVLQKVNVTRGGAADVYTFTYDAFRRVSKVTKTGLQNLTWNFEYDNSNKITRVETSVSDNYTFDFLYTGAGRINGYIMNDEETETEIVYDAVTDSYSFPAFNFSLRTDGDYKRLNQMIFAYVADKKGPMFNTNGSLHLMGLFLDNDFTYFATKLPIDYWGPTEDPQQEQFDNTYDADGYLLTSQVEGAVSYTFEYVLWY